MSATGSNWDSQTFFKALRSIREPNEFQGVCRNHRNCKQFQAVLANGYCTPCWDRGNGSSLKDYEWKPSMG